MYSCFSAVCASRDSNNIFTRGAGIDLDAQNPVDVNRVSLDFRRMDIVDPLKAAGVHPSIFDPMCNMYVAIQIALIICK